MSLNRAQMARTGEELRRHADASGLSVEQLAQWLGLTPHEVRDVLSMAGGQSPVTTWLLRDALDEVVRERGVDAGGWSVLTEDARGMATRWFSLRRVPPRPQGESG